MNRLLLALTLICTVVQANTSLAQGGGADSGSAANPPAAAIAPQPCDPQFYAQMNARAWQESEREIMQNQNLIFKADSILDYTCFDKQIALAAFHGGDIFTHTEYFGGSRLIPRGEPYGLEHTLELIVFQTYQNYRNANFEHSWLGGRGEHVGLPEFDPLYILPPQDRGYAAYTCDTMARVWQTSKCLNFVHNEEFSETDGFYPFNTLECAEGTDCTPIEGYDEKVDVRLYPAGMECVTEAGLFDWAGATERAENANQFLYDFQEPLHEIFLDVLDKTIPGNCLARNTVPTGVQVVLAEGPAQLDGVCTNPGCTYSGGGEGALGTCQ